jgi:hypothetical protein
MFNPLRRFWILFCIWRSAWQVDYQFFRLMIRKNLTWWIEINALAVYQEKVEMAVATALALDENGLLIEANVHMADSVSYFLSKGGDMIGQPWPPNKKKVRADTLQSAPFRFHGRSDRFSESTTIPDWSSPQQHGPLTLRDTGPASLP